MAHRLLLHFQHTAMLEGMLLLLLAIGGNGASPAAAVASPPMADPLVGVWRGSWTAQGGDSPVPVEAIVTGPSARDGQVLALVATGAGRLRRLTRVTGRVESDGARFTLPGGGSLRLATGSASRLIGIVKGAAVDGPMPGDGTLELARVRR
jgi:hypothetical protein